MRDRPNGAELAALAAVSDADPSLVRLARDIAAREAAAGAAPLRAERDRLAAFYGDVPDPSEPLESTLVRLNSRFARDLRAGRFDRPGPRRDMAHRILSQCARARLAEDNPEYGTAN